MKKLRIIYIVLIIVICISVMFVNAREPLDDDINVDVTVKSKVPTTTQTTVDGGTKYLGCYEDGRPRSLQPSSGHPEYFRYDTGLSKEVCAAKCKSYGYKYMGLQFARQCFCSDNFVTQESSTAFISVREHKWITLPTSTKIISARYGYGTKWYNVQNKVQSLISRRGEV